MDDHYFKDCIVNKPSPELGYGIPSWLVPASPSGSGAHNVKDKIFHMAKTSVRMRIFKNPTAKTLIRIAVLESRKHGASINILRDMFNISTGTIDRIIREASGSRFEMAFKYSIKDRLNGIPRTSKHNGSGRVDLKVKLEKRACRLWLCIRAVFAKGFDDVEKAIRFILGQSDEPP